MINLISKIISKLSNSYLYKQSIISLLIKVIGAIATFGFNILLARKLGAESTGIFFLSFTVFMIAVLLSRVGLDNIVLREVSKYALSEQWDKLKGVFSTAIRITLLMSVLISFSVYYFSDIIANLFFDMPIMEQTLQLLAYAIVPFSLLFIVVSVLKGLKKIGEATVAESIIIPCISIIVLYFIIKDNNLLSFLKYYIIIFYLAVGIAFYFLRSNTLLFSKKAKNYSVTQILKSSMPLLLVASMALINTWADRIFLGIYSTPEDVGIYSISVKIALLVSFILVAVNDASSSKFAELYHENKIKELSQYCIKSTNFMAVISLPVLILIIVFAEHILGIFGEEFLTGYIALIILCAGQFINVATGSVGQILAMTNRENLLKKSIFIGLISNITLNYFLVPTYGMLGAAVATSIGWSLTNIIALNYIIKEFKIRAHFLGGYFKI